MPGMRRAKHENTGTRLDFNADLHLASNADLGGQSGPAFILRTDKSRQN